MHESLEGIPSSNPQSPGSLSEKEGTQTGVKPHRVLQKEEFITNQSTTIAKLKEQAESWSAVLQKNSESDWKIPKRLQAPPRPTRSAQVLHFGGKASNVRQQKAPRNLYELSSLEVKGALVYQIVIQKITHEIMDKTKGLQAPRKVIPPDSEFHTLWKGNFKVNRYWPIGKTEHKRYYSVVLEFSDIAGMTQALTEGVWVNHSHRKFGLPYTHSEPLVTKPPGFQCCENSGIYHSSSCQIGKEDQRAQRALCQYDILARLGIRDHPTIDHGIKRVNYERLKATSTRSPAKFGAVELASSCFPECPGGLTVCQRSAL
jgi:hypothetical protein